jgi:hypothetical protein
MMVPSFTVTAVTAVTKKRDIPPPRVTQRCMSSRASYLCDSVGGDRPKTGYSGYSGYREPADRILETLSSERKAA